MSSLATQSSDALLESQQRLVDLGPLHPRLSVGRVGVCSSLVTSQVNQRELAKQWLLVVVDSQDDLKYFIAVKYLTLAFQCARCAPSNLG